MSRSRVMVKLLPPFLVAALLAGIGLNASAEAAADALLSQRKPVLTASDGKPYNTSAAIIDPGSVPEYKCSFPFRVPAGTKVASIQIDTAKIDVSGLETKK